jgi:N-acetylated-alpha-linked acidic dipeptidase
MKRSLSLSILCFALLSLLPLGGNLIAQEPSLMGFSAASSQAERRWEEKFRAIPRQENLRAYMERLTAHPHHVGSPYDRDNAEWLLAKFKEFGLDAHIENFDVLFPTPKERLVELVSGGPKYVAKLAEPALPQDPTSNQQAEQLPTYNAYSPDGDVTGPLVYVNYGVPEDYEELARHGISVKGAVVIARYGHAWRGIKPKVAAEHGAIGCLIYSDPRDDGYAAGDTFPNGPFRPKEGVQRGSVQDSGEFMGDPLTPGIGATPDAKRLPIKDAPTVVKIPVLPISQADAQPLMASITGATVPFSWTGGLPLTYHFGPGGGVVHLKVLANWDIKRLYDVTATVRGSTYPDEWVIRGNHHDAWVNGAEDPISGMVTVLEEARSIGELVKAGWKPKRTMIYCAWDGEEPGLLGSTEWAETHAEDLKNHAVAYLNSDSNGRGFLYVEGSHSLEKFINNVARDIQDPETKLTVWKRKQLREIRTAETEAARNELRHRADLRIGTLGGGSDYGPFLNILGIASLNMEYGGESDGGIYHSIYDDFYWYTHFSDTDFSYGKKLVETGGLSMLRLADADLLPFDFTDFADTLHMYLRELKKFSTDQQEDLRERNRQLDEGTFTASADPKQIYVAPKHEDIPPFLNFAPLDNAVDAITRSAAEFDKAVAAANQNGGTALASAAIAEINRMLIQSERKLTTPAGISGRPGYKHELYAPGIYTGYAAKAIPSVREAMEQKQWKQADDGIVRVSNLLENEAKLISAAAAKLTQAH